MVDRDSYLSIGASIAACHHERFDGRGYLQGLAGNKIPLPARIVSVVDVYDALVTRRPQRGGSATKEVAKRSLVEEYGVGQRGRRRPVLSDFIKRHADKSAGML